MCRRQGCSSLFSNDTIRRDHEYKCLFNSEDIVDKSPEKIENAITIVEGEIIDAQQFNALANSKKMECPICYTAVPPKSYKRHNENCRKLSGQSLNNNNLNPQTSGKSKTVLKAVLDLSDDEAEESDKEEMDEYEQRGFEEDSGVSVISSKEPSTRAGYFCDYCKKSCKSASRYQEHLNRHTNQKTFKCRRQGCSEHFANYSFRKNHETYGSCKFKNQPLIDKSGELINGKLLDACQFNSLPNSNKMECPICYTAVRPQSYKLHVERCRKLSGQSSNNNNSNSKSGGKSKDQLRTALNLNNDSEDDETISVPSNSNNNGSMSLRSSGKSKAVLKAALDLSADEAEESDKEENDISNFDQEQVLQPMLQDPNPFVPNDSMAQDDQPQNLDQLSNLFFIPGVKQPSSQVLSAPADIDAGNAFADGFLRDDYDQLEVANSKKRKSDSEPDLTDREQAKRLKINGGNLNE